MIDCAIILTFAIREVTRLAGEPPLTSAPALHAKCNSDRSVRLSLSSICAPLRNTCWEEGSHYKGKVVHFKVDLSFNVRQFTAAI